MPLLLPSFYFPSYTVYASARNPASLKGLEVEGVKALALDVTSQVGHSVGRRRCRRERNS